MNKEKDVLSKGELAEYRKLVLEENLRAIMRDARKFLDSIDDKEIV